MNKNWMTAGWMMLVLGCVPISQGQNINKIYYPSGVLKSIWEVDNGKLNGIKREYNEEGVLKSATTYKDGKIDGMNNMYRVDGSLWTKEIYENGKLITRQEFDEEGYLTAQDDFDQ